MTVFLISALAMALVALAFLLPSLLRAAPATAGAPPDANTPVWQGAGKSRAAAWSVGLLVPLVAAFTYVAIGTPRALNEAVPPSSSPEAVAAGPVGEGEGGAAAGAVPPQVEAMVARLAARLKEQPNDAAGWRRLARSYETLRRFAPAAEAYRKIMELEGESADLLVDYAVVLGMANNQRLAGEPEKALQRALKLDANHLQALALQGSAAMERGDADAARRPWRKILTLVPAESDIGRSIAASIAKLEAQASAR